MSQISRRRMLQGVLGGGTVAVALPILDFMLNENGTAFAATGRPLPIRFGTWAWGCGMTPARFIPKKVGANYDLPPELAPIAPQRQNISVLTDFKIIMDGRPNLAHFTGNVAIRSGFVPERGFDFGKVPSFDVMIANAVGANTRFRSLEVTATGNSRDSLSVIDGGNLLPSEISPIALYTRIFGSGFQDPNSAEFKPDPEVMLRQSVLSAVKDEREALVRQAGAADRQRLDQYFTSLRQLEQQLSLQLEKPPALEACVLPKRPEEPPTGAEIAQSIKTNRAMSKILAMALACNQTRVFNMTFGIGASTLRKEGGSTAYHQLTHEEPTDEKLQAQPQCTWFVEQIMGAWTDTVSELAAIKEGAGTLLDNCMIVAHSESEFAKRHSSDGIPVMIAGKAGGKIRSGLHVAGNGELISRVGYTALQVAGISAESFGTNSMTVRKPVSEILI